jgi:beta-lactamase superfamily II metal-dependent hydrolase
VTGEAAVVGQAAVLDVGHGNCCVIEADSRVAVIDTGRGDDLLLYLVEREIFDIDHLILSHGDEDHIGGGYWLLVDKRFRIDNVYYNSEQFRDTRVYSRVRAAAKDAEIRKRTNQGSLARGARLHVGSVLIEILHPSQSDVAGAQSTRDANSLSTIVRVSTSTAGGILFLAGDGDGLSLTEVTAYVAARGLDPRATFLIFPHHGSAVAAGREVSLYVEAWLELVRPKEVMFSTKRSTEISRWHHPDRRVVEAIGTSSVGDIRVMCTQLSVECCADLVDVTPDHVKVGGDALRHRSLGRFPCAGSAIIDLRTGKLIQPLTKDHEAFKDLLPTPMCRQGE